MPHYMFRANYTQQGIQGVMKDGAASRVAAVEAMAASVGGSIVSAYWAFGDDDFFAIAELPDNAAAMAIAATVGASGAVAAVLGAYALLFPRARVHTLIFLFIFLILFAFILVCWRWWWRLLLLLSSNRCRCLHQVFIRH